MMPSPISVASRHWDARSRAPLSGKEDDRKKNKVKVVVEVLPPKTSAVVASRPLGGASSDVVLLASSSCTDTFKHLLSCCPSPSYFSSTPSLSASYSPDLSATSAIAVYSTFRDQMHRAVNRSAVLACRGGKSRRGCCVWVAALVAVACWLLISAVIRASPPFRLSSSIVGSFTASPAASFSSTYSSSGNNNTLRPTRMPIMLAAPAVALSAEASLRLLAEPASATNSLTAAVDESTAGSHNGSKTMAESRQTVEKGGDERRQEEDNGGGGTTMGGSSKSAGAPTKGGGSTMRSHNGGGGVTEADENEDCYYLYIEMLLFVVVDILAMQQVAKIFRMNCQRDDSMPPVSLTGGKTRAFFIYLLVLANFARAVSLGFLGYLLSHQQSAVLRAPEEGSAVADQHQWLLTILRSAPSLLFLSTYSVVILFWAQVYYAAILVSLPLLKPCFVFINIAAYTVYVSAVVLSYLLQAYAELATYAAFLIGIFYSATALGVAYYGVKVSNKLSERSKQPSRKNSIIKRVLFLAIVCPLAFLLRGLYSLAFAVNMLPHFYPSSVTHPAWDALIFLVTEWLPSIMILAAFWHRKVSRGPRNVAVPSSSGGASSSVGGILTNNDYTTPLVENGYSPYAITQHMPQRLP
eukprot:GHVS01106276.1.p1 GENE.GHVS01106276.1~~GHVS01106276.1.p1  ORF type:complete len:637 (-),score=103.80 GHVS01106276.1:612-2522(-)